MSVLRILSREGDTAVLWNVKDEPSVAETKEKFDEMIEKGYLAYRIDSKESGEVIRSFDPAASEIIMNAPLVGG